MGRIQDYPIDGTPENGDILLGTNVLDAKKSKNYSIQSIVGLVPAGPSGASGSQGVQGVPGPPGPVGPAGLEWQGAWDANTSYALNDAVAFSGASWFCINPISTTGNDDPETDTVTWALLAAQGAQGPQGVQGPTGATGAQGPIGLSASTTYTDGSLNTVALADVSDAILEDDFTRVYVSGPSDNYIGISSNSISTGKYYVVQNKSTTSNVIVVPLDYCRFLQVSGGELQTSFTLKPNSYARFTLTNITGGSDRVFMIEKTNAMGIPDVASVTNTTTTELSVATLNSSYPSETYPNGTRVFCINIPNKKTLYTKISNSAWVSQPLDSVGAINNPSSYVGVVQFLPDGTIDDTSLYSDIVDDITVSQAGTGVYLFVSNGKFTSNKTIITPFAYQGTTTNSGAVRLPIYSSNAVVGHYWIQRQTASEVVMYFVDTAQNPINPYTLLGTRRITIDIKVYL